MGVVLPLFRGPHRPLHPPLRDGCDHRHPDPVVGDVRSYEHDVLVIGAGGAGLGAAIEAAAPGAKVALICKSLLGKAPPVMAEEGAAPALATVVDQDNCEGPFRATRAAGEERN